MTKNTKMLLWAVGLGAVAYYFWNKNKKARVATAQAGPSTAAVNWTGDLDVPNYQNAYGDTTRQRVDTVISGSSPFKHVVLKGNKPKNFTGDLGVPQYQNADGAHLTQHQVNRIANASPERAQRIYNRVSKRMGIR